VLTRSGEPTGRDRQAEYRYDISILQAELSLTQVLDRPLTGRVFVEDVIRENLDLGRPDQVSLIFNKRINRGTQSPVPHPSHHRRRHAFAARRLPNIPGSSSTTSRTRPCAPETTINDTRDFGIGRRLHNLPALRQISVQANQRLLDVQRVSADCHIGQQAFDSVCQPIVINHQRAAALRFGDPRVQALLSVLVVFRLLPTGFCNRDLRTHLAPLLGLDPSTMTAGRMTYDLRRLRLHQIIQRIPRTNRYQVTPFGLQIAMFFSRTYSRLLRTGLAEISDPIPINTPLRRHFDRLNQTITAHVDQLNLAA
jgi:hypothetical protein